MGQEEPFEGRDPQGSGPSAEIRKTGRSKCSRQGSGVSWKTPGERGAQDRPVWLEPGMGLLAVSSGWREGRAGQARAPVPQGQVFSFVVRAMERH